MVAIGEEGAHARDRAGENDRVAGGTSRHAIREVDTTGVATDRGDSAAPSAMLRELGLDAVGDEIEVRRIDEVGRGRR